MLFMPRFALALTIALAPVDRLAVETEHIHDHLANDAFVTLGQLLSNCQRSRLHDLCS